MPKKCFRVCDVDEKQDCKCHEFIYLLPPDLAKK